MAVAAHGGSGGAKIIQRVIHILEFKPLQRMSAAASCVHRSDQGAYFVKM